LESWVHRQIGCALNTKSRKKLDQGYIEKVTLHILNLLNRYRRKVTFFVVSEIFDWYPDLIRRIEEHGHEIAYHTCTHRYIETKQDLVEEIRQSKGFIEEFQPIGFRAPEGKMEVEHLKVLAEYGFEYDSSSYGNFDTSSTIHGVKEIPISTFRFFNSSSNLNLPQGITKRLLRRELPLGSGFFMSALGPFARVLPNLLSFHNKVPVLFVHPWQIVTHDTILSTHANCLFKQTALLLYSRGCLRSFAYLLSHFQTIRMEDLARKLPKVGNI
jgi:peptidoglycan/xylan/chitin deacetylase (PgdA/CDA1 family)